MALRVLYLRYRHRALFAFVAIDHCDKFSTIFEFCVISLSFKIPTTPFLYRPNARFQERMPTYIIIIINVNETPHPPPVNVPRHINAVTAVPLLYYRRYLQHLNTDCGEQCLVLERRILTFHATSTVYDVLTTTSVQRNRTVIHRWFSNRRS